MNKCPQCGEPMLTFEIEAIEIDRCEKCKGIWLDSGEIEYIAGEAGARKDSLHEAIENAVPIRKSTRKCPRCGKKLQEIEVKTGSLPIILDKCPKGDGIFFDRGEVKKVVAAFTQDEKGAVANFFKEFLRSELEDKE